MNQSNSERNSMLTLLLAIGLSLGIDFLILMMNFKYYLSISILSSLIFFGTSGILIGYKFKERLPWGLIILVGLTRFFSNFLICSNSIYEAILSLAIFTVFIDLGISFRSKY